MKLTPDKALKHPLEQTLCATPDTEIPMRLDDAESAISGAGLEIAK